MLLGGDDHEGSVEVTFEVDSHELLVAMVTRISNGSVSAESEAALAFDVVITDLVDRFDADVERGVVQFSKALT